METGVKISGFSFVKNAVKLYYPIVESIRSALPLVDEFVIACGDSDDGTTELIRTIDDPKLKIIETVWNPDHFVHGAVNAVQSNIALDECTGDWCFYLQADEVVHEKYLPVLRAKMEQHLDTPEVEGLLFDYVHFYGSYNLYQIAHNWYAKEVRIVRNGTGVRSWESAQGFRIDKRKLHVADADAEIDAYAQARYSVPLAGPPDMIRKIAVDLALYGLFSARGIDPESADRSIVDGHRAALQFLDRLSRGHVTIGVATPAKDEGASVTAPSRIFTRDGMEGW